MVSRNLYLLYFYGMVKVVPIVKNPKYIVVTQFPKTTYHYHVNVIYPNIYADIGFWRKIYKYSEGIEVLKQKLIPGKEYLFSDMLQKEKDFKVEWVKGVLDKIEKHPNSANCFVSRNRYYLYAKEL